MVVLARVVFGMTVTIYLVQSKLLYFLLFAPVPTPLQSSVKLSPDSGVALSDPTPYRRLIGKMNFMTHTRPDICFAIQHLSQFLSAPSDVHWDATIHLLRYLSGAPSHGILLNSSPDFRLQAFCDADWAACSQSRRSVSGYVVMLGGSLLFWKFKKHLTISLSSTEAEYRSLRRVTAELAWLTRLLTEFDVPDIAPVPVKCDSQAAIHIAKNTVFNERTKHIDIDCHFVRECLLNGLISLSYVPTLEQPADLLTKPLSGSLHHGLLNKLGVFNSPSNLRGDVRIYSEPG